MKKLLLILLYLFSNSLYSADTLVLTNNLSREYVLGGMLLEILEDSSKALTIEDISTDVNQNKFKQNKETYAYNFNQGSAYWVKFIIKNESGSDRNFILESYSPHTYLLQLFYIGKDGKLYEQQTGQSIKKENRIYHHKNLVLDLPVPEPPGTRTFYVRVYSNHHSSFDYHIKSSYYFSYYSTTEYHLLGIYYGILLIMSIYNLIIFFTIRAKLHLYYVFYIASGMLSSLTEDRLGTLYLWGNYSLFINDLLSYYIAPIALLLTFIFYGIEFLELKTKNKKFYLTVLGSTLIYLLLITFAVTIAPLNYNVLRSFYVLPFLIICIASYHSWIKGYRPARLYVLATTFTVISIILIQLRSVPLIMPNLFTVYFLNYSMIVESVVLSFALSDRIKIFQNEKEEAKEKALQELHEKRMLQEMVNQQLKEKQALQEKVNIELENKVDKRTEELKLRSEELEISNSKLKSIIDQANKMNIRLDLDNWELKKNVLQGLLQQITGHEVSQETFERIFKDEITCYKFLDELKWANGYKCRKCHNNKFTELEKDYTRKCSRCSYPESVTAHTILHGIKFDINKALYIVYLIHKRKGKVKLEEISKIAQISIVSCSKFKSKITDQMELLDKKIGLVNWEEIIFTVE